MAPVRAAQFSLEESSKGHFFAQLAGKLVLAFDRELSWGWGPRPLLLSMGPLYTPWASSQRGGWSQEGKSEFLWLITRCLVAVVKVSPGPGEGDSDTTYGWEGGEVLQELMRWERLFSHFRKTQPATNRNMESHTIINRFILPNAKQVMKHLLKREMLMHIYEKKSWKNIHQKASGSYSSVLFALLFLSNALSNFF